MPAKKYVCRNENFRARTCNQIAAPQSRENFYRERLSPPIALKIPPAHPPLQNWKQKAIATIARTFFIASSTPLFEMKFLPRP